MNTEEQANLYELRGGATQISYSTTSIDGTPKLGYEGPDGESHSFSGDEIATAHTELGLEVTVTLRAIPDAGTTAATVLIPPARLENNEAAIDTVAIVTTKRTSIAGPPPGQNFTYEVVELSGSALFVLF